MSFLVGLYLFVFPTTTFQAPCRMESLLHDQPEPPSKGSAIISLSSACRIEMKLNRNISANSREILLGSRHCMYVWRGTSLALGMLPLRKRIVYYQTSSYPYFLY